MLPPDLPMAAQAINSHLATWARQSKLTAHWRAVTARLRADLLAASDALCASWSPEDLARELGQFLRRARVVQAPPTGGERWQPPEGLVDSLVQDLLAVAYYRFYRVLVALPPRLWQAAAAGDRAALDAVW